MNLPRSLTSYRFLGRSGARVSPIALGTMTFGRKYNWGVDIDDARLIFDTYVDRGGNFIDTANTYSDGASEVFIGKFANGKRPRLVIASKYSMTTAADDPNAGGNHRKNMMRSVEESLKRLNTDYIDLYYLHGWDDHTSVEEIMRGMDDLVRSGKVTYVALSNTPAWQVARMQTISDLRGWAPLIAFELQYSLVERAAERDMIPMARELGLGVIPWSPLGSGLLTGKYSRADLNFDATKDASSRKAVALTIGVLTERSLNIADAVREIAKEVGKTPAQVALAWTLLNPAVTAPIIGARTIEQLEDNLGALGVELSDAQEARLDEVSAIELGYPHDLLASSLQTMLLGQHPAPVRCDQR